MRTFTKILSVLLLTIFGAFGSTNAQDWSAHQISSYSDGDTLVIGSRFQTNWQIRLQGSSFPASDSINIQLAIDDSVVNETGYKSFSDAVNTGIYGNQNVNGFNAFLEHISPKIYSEGMHEVCLIVTATNNSDATNDTTCIDMFFDSRQIDIGVSNISSPSPGSTIYTDSLLAYYITFQNYGSQSLPKGIPFPVRFESNASGNGITQWISLDKNLGAGDTASRYIIGFLPITEPTGNKKLCFETKWADSAYGAIDPDSTNDRYCQSYNVSKKFNIETTIENYNNWDTTFIGNQVNLGWRTENTGPTRFPYFNQFGQALPTTVSLKYTIDGQVEDSTAIHPLQVYWTPGQFISASGTNFSASKVIRPSEYNAGDTIDFCFTTTVKLDTITLARSQKCVSIIVDKKQWDIGITSVNEPKNSELRRGKNNQISLTIKNFSSTSIPQSASFPMTLSIDGSPQVTTYVYFDQELAANDSINRNITIGLPSNTSLETHNFCFNAQWDQYGVDPSSNNDEACQDFVIIKRNSSIGSDESVVEAISIYPNPTDRNATIEYNLRSQTRVKLTVHSLDGKITRTLVNGTQMSGEHSVNLNVGGWPSGVYIYRLATQEGTKTGKILVK